MFRRVGPANAEEVLVADISSSGRARHKPGCVMAGGWLAILFCAGRFSPSGFCLDFDHGVLARVRGFFFSFVA